MKSKIRQSKKKLSKKNKKTKKVKPNKSKKSKKTWSLSDDILSSDEMAKFRSSKSVSLASRLTGIKDTLVSELIELPISESIYKLCSKKLEKLKYINPSTGEKHKITNELANNVCHCLFNKNKDLSISELEKKVTMKVETPASECIKILDKHYESK
jgi:hypothetical protein